MKKGKKKKKDLTTITEMKNFTSTEKFNICKI